MLQHDRSVIDKIPPVPPGTVRTCECGQQPPGSMAEWVILAACPQSTISSKHPVQLVYRSRGYVIAGSCLRWCDHDNWGVIFQDTRNNTTYGQWYRTRPEAEAHWSKVTPVG